MPVGGIPRNAPPFFGAGNWVLPRGNDVSRSSGKGVFRRGNFGFAAAGEAGTFEGNRTPLMRGFCREGGLCGFLSASI